MCCVNPALHCIFVFPVWYRRGQAAARLVGASSPHLEESADQGSAPLRPGLFRPKVYGTSSTVFKSGGNKQGVGHTKRDTIVQYLFRPRCVSARRQRGTAK